MIGTVQEISKPFELLSFRIENDSTSYTLLEPNLYMEGNMVLTVGVLNVVSKEIYYLQQIMDQLDIHAADAAPAEG